MFAPKVAKPQTKAVESVTSKLALSSRTVNDGSALRLLERRNSSPTGGEPPKQDEQQADPATRTTFGASWDFIKMPIFAPDRVNPARSSPGALPERVRAMQRPAAAVPLQRRLKVGAVDDPLEREADRVAEEVMRGTAVPANGLRKNEAVPAAPALSEVPASVHAVLRSPGQPLDAATRTFFEPRFGQDFSAVRVHTDPAAARSAREVNAKAYTVGRNVAFDAGLFAPGTHSGRRLLAHELVHIVQQRGSPLVLRRQINDPRNLRIERSNEPRSIYAGEWIETPGRWPGDTPGTEEVYWVKFDVDDQGVMRASARTVSPDRRYRSPQLRLKSEFRRALQHFEDNGVEIKAFEADWSYMTADEISDNLRSFRESVAEGSTLRRAASRTPTGKVLEREAFEVTDVRNDPEQQPHLAEQGLRRWRVKATFRPARGSVTPAGGKAVRVKAASGALPPRGSVIPAGGTTKLVNTTTGLITTKNAAPTHGSPAPEGGELTPIPSATSRSGVPKAPGSEAVSEEVLTKGPQVRSPVGGGRGARFKAVGGVVLGAVAELAISIAVTLLGEWIKEMVERQELEDDLIKLRPEMLNRLDGLSDKIVTLQKGGPVFANITVESIWSHTFNDVAGEDGIERLEMMQYSHTTLKNLDVSHQKIESSQSSEEPIEPHNYRGTSGNLHVINTYSFSLEPSSTTKIADAMEKAPDYRVVFGLTEDTEIRNWIFGHDKEVLGTLPPAEKIRLINRLLDGWVSSEDMDAIRKLCATVQSREESQDIRSAIKPRGTELGIGQFATLLSILSKMP